MSCTIKPKRTRVLYELGDVDQSRIRGQLWRDDTSEKKKEHETEENVFLSSSLLMLRHDTAVCHERWQAATRNHQERKPLDWPVMVSKKCWNERRTPSDAKVARKEKKIGTRVAQAVSLC